MPVTKGFVSYCTRRYVNLHMSYCVCVCVCVCACVCVVCVCVFVCVYIFILTKWTSSLALHWVLHTLFLPAAPANINSPWTTWVAFCHEFGATYLPHLQISLPTLILLHFIYEHDLQKINCLWYIWSDFRIHHSVQLLNFWQKTHTFLWFETFSTCAPLSHFSNLHTNSLISWKYGRFHKK